MWWPDFVGMARCLFSTVHVVLALSRRRASTSGSAGCLSPGVGSKARLAHEQGSLLRLCCLLQLPPGWSEGKDPSSGATYYYNTATGGEACSPCCACT